MSSTDILEVDLRAALREMRNGKIPVVDQITNEMLHQERDGTE